ncbi:MAG: lipoprotein, partial [Elusimicrobia bacterium]
PVTIAAVAPVASKAIAGIPEAFLKAFPATSTTAGAALTLAGAATAAAASWGIAGYEVYKLLQWKAESERVLAERQKNLERARVALGLIPGAIVQAPVDQQEALKLGWVNLDQVIKDWEKRITPAPEVTPEVVTPPKPAVVVIPEPGVVVKPGAAPAPGPQVFTTPGPTPQVTINVAPSPAPNVEVNVPPVPQPLEVTGPMTATQLMAAIPFLATSQATASHKQTQNCIPTTGAALLQAALGALIPALIVGGFMFNDTLRGAMTSVAQKFVNAIYSPLTAQAPITPEKGPAIGALLLSQAVMFGSGAHIMSILAEAAAPLKHLGVGYLAAFMADAAGFSRIAAAYQGM